MRRLFASTLGQIVAIVVCSSLVTFLLFLGLMSFHPGASRHPPWSWETARRIVDLVELLEGVPEDERKHASVLASAQRPDMSVTLGETTIACASNSRDARDLETVLRTGLRRLPELAVRSCDSGDPATMLQVLVPMGRQVLEIRTGNAVPGRQGLRFPSLRALLLMFVSGTAMSIWAMWRIVLPARRLSRQVDAFGREVSPTPIEEEGAAEIRSLARAFNLMQERIARSVQARTRMLAAINHDLRTPLTRMRLQIDASANGDEVDLGKLRKNIDLMQTMVTSGLAFLNGSYDDEAEAWVDLDALLSTLCDEYEESGAAIRYEGPGRIRFRCRPNAIQRALVNLIENALHFGRSAAVTASIEGDSILIEVADDGPGIPPEHLQAVVEPFVRLDASGNNRSGSVGLGLSIVQEIVQAHGGTLALANRQPTGLVARIGFR